MRKRRNASLCIAVCCLSLLVPSFVKAAHATITGRVVCPGTCALVDLKLTGQIGASDASELQHLLDSLHETASVQRKEIAAGIPIQLNSPGGSVTAAMTIGRLLRKEEIGADVEPNAICASACVLIFAGAVLRSQASNLAIHRPYLEVPSQKVTNVEVKEAYATMLADIRSYLREMNVAEGLADAMLRIPPEEIHFLTLEEADTYGLTAVDPVFQETLDLERAQKLGISRQEYVRRNALATQRCHFPGTTSSVHEIEAWNACVNQTLATGHPPAPSSSDFTR